MASDYIVTIDINLEGRDSTLVKEIDNKVAVIFLDHYFDVLDFGLQGRFDDQSIYQKYKKSTTSSNIEEITYEIKKCLEEHKDKISSAQVRNIDLEEDGEVEELFFDGEPIGMYKEAIGELNKAEKLIDKMKNQVKGKLE